MTPNGPNPHDVITRVQRRYAAAADLIHSRLSKAWDDFRWRIAAPTSGREAWARLQGFAAVLLASTGTDTESLDPLAPVVSDALLRWLEFAQTSPDEAVEWLLDPEESPDALLERIADAAEADLLRRSYTALLTATYQGLPMCERVAWVRRLLSAYPRVAEGLSGVPDWSYADDLPELHSLCLEDRRAENST